ncbi:hypothetical protein SDC9_207574 [bioreactor metagenome]|uniref:Uncharacterized protein n=1 Tax=bioreactor metagenome TaxID=1076179 RepID=A0A645J9S2_9ZZZZ
MILQIVKAYLISSAFKQCVLDNKVVNTRLATLTAQLGIIGNGNSLVINENTSDRFLKLDHKIRNDLLLLG